MEEEYKIRLTKSINNAFSQPFSFVDWNSQDLFGFRKILRGIDQTTIFNNTSN